MSAETLSRVLLSSIEVGADGSLPTEFRLFKRGMNETTKGPFLFDDEAARIVMAQWQREGVDMIADLEHLSLDPSAQHYDPDARAHFQLSVRNGELWGQNVRWTEDGAERLNKKTQRYISPVAMRDDATKRVLAVFNVGLVAQPATYGAQPLVAASKSPRLAEQSPVCKALIAMLSKHLGTPSKKVTKR